MGTPSNHENQELANRLIDHAESIVNVAAHDLELDLRAAAAVLQEIENPLPLLPRLVADLTAIARTTTDAETRKQLARIIGEV
jgi:hypothetical protein